MKKGTFLIIEQDGNAIAIVRREHAGDILLEGLTITDKLRALSGSKCQYLPRKGQKARNVIIKGKTIYRYVPKPKKEEENTEEPVSVRELLQTAVNQDDEPIQHQPFTPPVFPDSFLLKNTKVPADVRKIKIDSKKIDNFHLKLNRFARYEKEDAEKKVKEKFYFFNAKAVKNKAKKVLLEAFEIKANFEKIKFDNLTSRQRQHAEALLGNGKLKEQTFQPDWRLIVGLGGASVYETSITLHHVYGFPYIPASSVKGVLRSYIITEYFSNEGEAIRDKLFCDVFGCPAELLVELENGKRNFKSHYEEARRGKVTFFDALPTKAPNIQPDIMNPHYPDWYGEGKAPADTQSPVPIYFLTVADAPFQFLFGSKHLDTNQTFFDKTLADWLKEALAEHGIGAKTAVGYGIMETS